METKITINEPTTERDYFPCLFSNKTQSVIIMADERVNDRCFSGMVIHSDDSSKKTLTGIYSAGWTYEQFTRLKKGSEIGLKIIQGDI